MNTAINPALGPLVTRLSLGIMLIVHSVYLKGVLYTLAGTAAYFDSIGLPGWGAYAVFAVELVAGVALIIGYQVRLAAASVIPVLLGATWAHWPAGWLFSNEGGGWEYPLFLAAIALAQVFLGPGAYALRKSAPSRALVTPAA